MQAVEGSLLVVDASQGVEAQTLANVYQAIDADHEIVPVLNKIDLPAADIERVSEQIEDVIGIDASDAVQISAKTGLGIPDVLEAIVHRLPAPKGDRDAPLKAMLVDSYYDAYLGVVVIVLLALPRPVRRSWGRCGRRRRPRRRPLPSKARAGRAPLCVAAAAAVAFSAG